MANCIKISVWAGARKTLMTNPAISEQEPVQDLLRSFACLAHTTNVARIVTALTGPSAWDQPVTLALGNAQVPYLGCLLTLFTLVLPSFCVFKTYFYLFIFNMFLVPV